MVIAFYILLCQSLERISIANDGRDEFYKLISVKD
jgi:hypothetical protein